MRPKPRPHSSHPTHQNTTQHLHYKSTTPFYHKQRAKNHSPNTRPETKLLKTHSKHNTKSQANNSHYESTHNNTLGEVQRNTQHNIQNNSQTHSRICQHNLVPHHIKHKHEQITNNTKLSTPKNNRMHTRHKRTSPAHRNKNSPHRHTHDTHMKLHRHTHETPIITTTSTRPETHTAPAHHARTTSKTQNTNNLP